MALGDGTRMWLIEAASAGASKVRMKMADAVQLTRLHGIDRVDWALGHAASFGRFARGDVASILAAHPLANNDAPMKTTRCKHRQKRGSHSGGTDHDRHYCTNRAGS